VKKRPSQIPLYFTCSYILLWVFSKRKITDNRQRRMSSALQVISFTSQLNCCTKFDKYFRRKFSHFYILHSHSEMLHASPRRYPNGKCTYILNQRRAIHIDVGVCAFLEWRVQFWHITCMISHFCCVVDEVCALLGCCAACSGKHSSTFRDNLSVPSSGTKIKIYHCTLRNNPEERSSPLIYFMVSYWQTTKMYRVTWNGRLLINITCLE